MKKCILCYISTSLIRIDKYLSIIYKISRNNIIFLIKKKNILVNDKIIKKKYILKKYDVIKILKNNFRNKIKIFPIKNKLDILYEDKYILIINKKANTIVTPTFNNNKKTLYNYLLYYFNKSFLKKKNINLINRLDKDTTGIILIAKNFKVLLNIQNQFKLHKVIKKYILLVNGIFKKKRLCIKNNICRSKKNKKKMTVSMNRGKYSITFFKKIKILKNNITLLKCYLKTGRTHQIRVHLSSINFPIYNDFMYKNNLYYKYTKKKIINRICLHSYYIKFFHPIYKKYIIIYSKIPKDFTLFLKYLYY
ncbi:MAG: RluA family pseudouridine synthase [Candidatus Shikimatogenerans sp. Tduv]|uniref:Pseudouridine synthase n=1 Tax=Candidatus Shikimatogenerans sp. Tduv TaxID=3158567 RepID=A0AAU7QTW4_9FLAO